MTMMKNQKGKRLRKPEAPPGAGAGAAGAAWAKNRSIIGKFERAGA